MAQETGLWIKLKAMFDKKQVQTEATEMVDTAQKTLDKKELKLKLNDNLTELKKKLAETRAEYEKLLNQPMGGTTDKQLQQMEDHMEDLRNEIKQNEQALKDMGGASNKLGGAFQGLIGKISAFGVALKVFQTLKNIFSDFQESQKILVKATGASGEALKQLSDDMLAVQGKVWQSQTEIAEAVGELNTRLGLTGKELQDFTTKYLKFASVTGQDSKTAIESNIKMFSVWGISAKQQSEYLDKLTVAGQKTGVSVQNLTNQLQTQAPVLQEMGFSLEDSIALLSNFEQAGVEASSVLASMKIGLKNLVEGGENPSQALQDIINSIQNAKTDTEAMNIAFETFGSRGGIAMYNAIKNGTFALDDMKKALEDVNGAVEETFSNMETWGDLFGRMWEGIKGEVAEFGRDSFDNFKHIVEFNAEWIKQTKDLMQGHTELRLVYDRETGSFKGLQAVYKDDYYNKMKLEEATEKLKTKTEQFNEAIQDSNDAIRAFAGVSVNQQATRNDFEKTRQQAISTTEAVVGLLKTLAQLNNQKIDTKKLSGEAITGADLKEKFDIQQRMAMAIKNLDKLKNSTYQGKDDGGIMGNELLGGSGGGGGKGKSKAEEMLEEFDKNLKTTWGDLDSFVKEHEKTYETAKKNIEKVENEYDKLREAAKKTWEDAEKSIKSYNEQLEKNQMDSITKLGQRYVELKKELLEVDSYMKRIVEDLSWKDLEFFQDQGTTEYRGYQVKDLIELKEKLDELKLIEENTTEEQRKSEEFTRKTSKAQEILNAQKEKELELEQKKAIALEKQAIAQSMMNQENGKKNIMTLTKDGEDVGTWYYDKMKDSREKIANEENIQYAKQLENQSNNLSEQLAQYTDEKNYEVEVLVDATARKVQLEKEYKVVYQESIAKQKKGIDELIAKTQELIDKRREYLSMGGESHNAYGGSVLEGKVSVVGENGPETIIARQSSYVQPRNASNTYSTVNNNNSSSFSINGMEVNVNNVDEFLDDLRQKMTYRN